MKPWKSKELCFFPSTELGKSERGRKAKRKCSVRVNRECVVKR